MSTKKKPKPTVKEKPQVKIVFDGVMAVGPGHPDRDETRPGPFFGVMARATRRLSDRTRVQNLAASAGKQKTEPTRYTPIHIPTVFTMLEPTEDSRPPDQVLQLSPFHPKWYLWHPVRERLEFRFDGNGTPGALEYYRQDVELPSAPLAIHTIENVPDLRRIWPARSVLLDGLLSADPAVSDKVATQVFVPYGTVAGAGTLDRGKPLDVVFDPVRGLDAHPSLVPNAAVLVYAEDIEIASFSLDSGEPLDSIRLRASEGAEIYVSNGDPSDVEIDTEKLAIQILKAILEGKGELSKEAKQFGRRISKAIGAESVEAGVRRAVEFYHGGATVVHNGLAVFRRLDNVDLDFELYYALMKNEKAAADGKGLPVPKRTRQGDTFNGPNCYVSICDTHDRLIIKHA